MSSRVRRIFLAETLSRLPKFECDNGAMRGRMPSRLTTSAAMTAVSHSSSAASAVGLVRTTFSAERGDTPARSRRRW